MTTLKLANIYWPMLIADSCGRRGLEIAEDYQKRIQVVLSLVSQQCEITLPIKATWSVDDFELAFTEIDWGLTLSEPADMAIKEVYASLKMGIPIPA